MKLEIVTPNKTAYQGIVKLVQLPGITGSFELMESHAPIISTLGVGKIKVIEHDGNIIYFDTNGGVIEMNNNVITVLVESA